MIDYHGLAEKWRRSSPTWDMDGDIASLADLLQRVAREQREIDAKIAENLEITSIYEAWDFQQQCADAIRTQPTYFAH